MSAPSRMTIAIIAAVLVLAGLAVPAAHAQKTIHVPGNYSTIQAAINDSAHGDEILVAPGIYNETIDFLGKAIHLRSSDGPDVTIIDATGIGGSVVRCINGEGPDTILEGFTITGGTGTLAAGETRGGGMYNQGTSPTVVNCVFTGNTAFRGGGMQNINGASPTVTNCTFIDNSAEHGGGLHFFNCPNPVVTNCTFIGNFANGAGGGMFANQSSPTVTDCVFTDNTANNGGGMHIGGDSNPTVTGSTFTGNSANQFGGGMNSANNSSPTVTNCTFAGNTAGSDGGGIRVNTEASPSIADSLLCDNVPDNIDGAWIDEGANELRVSCTSNTPPGSDVKVVIEADDGTEVRIEFEEVIKDGDTTVHSFEVSSKEPSPIGHWFGEDAFLHIIKTSAEFVGPVKVCFTWSEGRFMSEDNLSLVQRELAENINPVFTDITTSVDKENRVICGEIESFKNAIYFGIVEEVDPPTAVCNAFVTDDPAISGSAITVISSTSVQITLDGSGSSDPHGFDIEFWWSAGKKLQLLPDKSNPALASGIFPLGTTTVVLTVANEFGAASTCEVVITVEEPSDPATVFVTTDTNMLWPPNHKMRSVQVVVTAIDFAPDPFEVFPVNVWLTSSEPDNAEGNGDGNTTGDTNGEDGYIAPVDISGLFAWDPDFFSPGDGAWVATIELRAERAGDGDGREYTIELEALDLYNLKLGVSSAPVAVPKSQGKGGGPKK